MYTLEPAKERELYNYDRFPIRLATDKGTRYREAYGRKFPGNPSDLDIEMWCAARRLTKEQGGLGEAEHFKRVIQLCYPYLVPEWSHWLQMQMSCFVGQCGTHAILGGGGIGKDQPLSSRIRVPDGWTTMGEIRLGDSVCTPDGQVSKVIGVHPQGLRPVYRVTFSDGTSTETGPDHLWKTTTGQDRATKKRQSYRKGTVKTTLEIKNTLSSHTKKFTANHHIPITKPVYGKEVDLPIGPYLLGALLGDGGLTRNIPCLHLGTLDLDILEYCKQENPALVVAHYKTPTNPTCNTYALNGISKELKSLNLRVKGDKKFIPKSYLCASPNQRLELFRGLVDTDGGINNKECVGIEWSTISPRLAADFKDLAEGLGFIVTEHSRYTKKIKTVDVYGKPKIQRLTEQGSFLYRFYVRCPDGVMPFKNERRAKKFKSRTKNSLTRAIVSVEYVGEKETQCITIDHPDHLYITDNYIVTHNSWSLGTFARLWQACNPTERGVMIINTTQKSQSERAWKYVIDACQNFPWLPGVLSPSQDNPHLNITVQVPDPKNPTRMLEMVKPGVGIISQTVKGGSTARGTADIKGMHPGEFLVIVEEANHLRRTKLERARANWITNKYYQIILAGNPEIEDVADTTREDSLYHFAEPIHGWGTIEWGKTRAWPNKFGGKAFHFDPYDSPRIHAPNRYRLSTWLPDMNFIELKAKELGGTNSQLFKQQIRGIYDHESLPFNPIMLSTCKKFDVYRKANFTGMQRQRWAAFDPAYSGGDEAFLKIAESGLTEENRIEVDFLGEATNFVFKLDSKSGDEHSFQMMKWVRAKCEEWDVPPENFIMDANVIGIGMGDILVQFWSKKINKIIVMGQPTDRQLDLQGTFTAKERCANKQTELWLAMQQLIITSQVRGLDESIVNELVEMPAETLNGKIKILPKTKFRERFGYSPDRAECCIFIVDLLRTRGLRQGASPDFTKLGQTGLTGDFAGVTRIEDVFTNMAPRSYGEKNPYLVDTRLQGMNRDLPPGLEDMTGNVFRWKQSMF